MMAPRHVTRRELAHELGVHPRTISKWQEEGLPVVERRRGPRGYVYDAEISRAWAKARREAHEAGHADLTQARAHREHWMGLLAEQRFKLRERQLLQADQVATAWTCERRAIRQTLLKRYNERAAKAVQAAAERDGLGGVERELKTVAYAALRELADPTRPVGRGATR